jgi:hypothetical protein
MATVTASLNGIVSSIFLKLNRVLLTLSETSMDSVTVTSAVAVVTPSDMVMPWLTERLKEAWQDVVAARLSGWLTSFPLSEAAVTPSDMVMPWVTDL